MDYTDKLAEPMPGKRSDDKRHLNAWIWETDHKVLGKVAKENGMTLTSLIEYLIGELRKKQPNEIRKWHEKQKRNN